MEASIQVIVAVINVRQGRVGSELPFIIIIKVCICFPTPGRGLPFIHSGLGLSRCLGPGECLHSFISFLACLCGYITCLHDHRTNPARLKGW